MNPVEAVLVVCSLTVIVVINESESSLKSVNDGLQVKCRLKYETNILYFLGFDMFGFMLYSVNSTVTVLCYTSVPHISGSSCMRCSIVKVS